MGEVVIASASPLATLTATLAVCINGNLGCAH